jgi:hypothetical protein
MQHADLHFGADLGRRNKLLDLLRLTSPRINQSSANRPYALPAIDFLLPLAAKAGLIAVMS